MPKVYLSGRTYLLFLTIAFTYAMYHFGEKWTSRSRDRHKAQVSLVMGAALLWALIVITWLLHSMEVIA